jgi:hypothetical protein
MIIKEENIRIWKLEIRAILQVIHGDTVRGAK